MNKNTKGILLAAGTGTRLMPATLALSKPLLPVYDKPMIYYPLETLVRLGIKDILFIILEDDVVLFKKIFGTGKEVGLNFSYEIQKVQRGISDAYIIANDFLNGTPSVLALSDNIFLGKKYFDFAKSTHQKMLEVGGGVFGVSVPDPEKFGVIELDINKQIIGIEEKPLHPKSDLIIPGMYFFDHMATEFVKQLKPSKRGELEITDLIEIYLKKDKLGLQILDKSIEWYDTGNAKSLLEASAKVKNFEDSQKQKLGSYEIACFEMGFITKDQLSLISQKYNKSDYGQFISQYLKAV